MQRRRAATSHTCDMTTTDAGTTPAYDYSGLLPMVDVPMVPVDLGRVLALQDALDGLDVSDAVEAAEELAGHFALVQRLLERQDFALSPEQARTHGAELYDVASLLQSFALRILGGC